MILSINNLVKIRTLDWYSLNKSIIHHDIGLFSEEMSKYCGKEAKIIKVSYISGFFIYKLNIDDGKYDWQDFMFDIEFILNNSIKNFCNICIAKSDCNKYCMFKNKKHLLLDVGDKIKFRSSRWIEFNKKAKSGYFNDNFLNSLLPYCDKEAEIIGIQISSKLKIKYYKLKIDKEEWHCQDYVFDLSYIENKLSNFCENECMFECKEDNCPLFNLKK